MTNAIERRAVHPLNYRKINLIGYRPEPRRDYSKHEPRTFVAFPPKPVPPPRMSAQGRRLTAASALTLAALYGGMALRDRRPELVPVAQAVMLLWAVAGIFIYAAWKYGKRKGA